MYARSGIAESGCWRAGARIAVRRMTARLLHRGCGAGPRSLDEEPRSASGARGYDELFRPLVPRNPCPYPRYTVLHLRARVSLGNHPLASPLDRSEGGTNVSGHSKWAQIKRQKGVNDAKRGQLFTKLGREITVAAREGGADPNGNFRLRLAIQHARENNMPMENVERAIKRGVGGGEGGANFEEITYEGYGPAGVALMVHAVTDNRNRTASEVRSVFTRGGGNLGETGCVSWLFDARGQIAVPLNGNDADDLTLQAIDAGAEDVVNEGDVLVIYTQPDQLETVRHALEVTKTPISDAEQTMVPKTTVEVDERQAEQLVKLVDRLEELDDVQAVYSNSVIPDAVAEKLAG